MEKELMGLKKAKRTNNDKKKYITFMLVPHSGKSLFNLRLPEWLVKGSLAIIITAGLIFCGSLLYSSRLSVKLVNHKQLIKENKRQQQYLSQFEKETQKIEKSVKKLENDEQEIRKMLGLPPKNKKGFSLFKSDKKHKNTKEKLSFLLEKFNYLKEHLSFTSKCYAALKTSAQGIHDRFLCTPSTMPAKGRIISGFGYRLHPVYGYVRMHDGIDIKCRFGTIIRASASGVVVKSGWEGGYGYSILIDNGYGYSTRYAHNSRNLVSVGDKVEKGDIIAHTGSTGLATGTHLHYEVRKFDQPINPASFLNLNVFTARKKIWYNNRS